MISDQNAIGTIRLLQAVAFIDAQRKLGHKVYIHCKAETDVRAKIGLEVAGVSLLVHQKAVE